MWALSYPSLIFKLPVWVDTWSGWRVWQTAPHTGWRSHRQSPWGTSVSHCETWARSRTVNSKTDVRREFWLMCVLLYKFSLFSTSVTLCASVRTLYTNVLISFVSKIYPSGIQLRKRRRVSRVAWTRGAFWEFSYGATKRQKAEGQTAVWNQWWRLYNNVKNEEMRICLP